MGNDHHGGVDYNLIRFQLGAESKPCKQGKQGILKVPPYKNEGNDKDDLNKRGSDELRKATGTTKRRTWTRKWNAGHMRECVQ